MNDMELKKHIERARIRLIAGQPFFGSLIMKLPLVENASVETCATDGVKIYYSRDFIAGLPVDEFAGVLAHEIAHVAFKHTLRRGDRDPHDWNVACDYAVNPICKKSGCVLPQSALLNAAYNGLSAEEIYKQIHVEPPEGGSGGEGNEDGEGDSGDSQSGDNTSPDNAKDPGGCGGVLDAPLAPDGQQPAGLKPASPKDVDGNVRVQAIDDVDIRQADMAAKMAGQANGSITGEIDELLKPKQDWRAMLREYMQPARDDWSYRRFNRRNTLDDVLLPSPDGEESGELVLAVDTSGSVTDEQLTQFCSEIQAIVDDTNPQKITVIYADYSVNRVDEFEQGEDLTFEYGGRGGTSLRGAFEHVAEKQIDPACFVYMTDLYVCDSDFPDDEPDYPVIWLSCGADKTPWGDVVVAHDI